MESVPRARYSFLTRMADEGDCRRYPADWWDTDSPVEQHRQAATVCLGCPLQLECYIYHCENKVMGVRGGYFFPQKGKPGPVKGLDYDKVRMRALGYRTPDAT